MCSSGVLKLWVAKLDDEGKLQVQLKSELLFGRNLQEVTEIKMIGQSDMLLLTGGYDSKIHVYMTGRGFEKTDLRYLFSMAGHFNSIKALSFSPELSKNTSFLASGSQDNNIRIWKLQPMDNLANKAVDHDDEESKGDDEWMK